MKGDPSESLKNFRKKNKIMRYFKSRIAKKSEKKRPFGNSKKKSHKAEKWGKSHSAEKKCERGTFLLRNACKKN